MATPSPTSSQPIKRTTRSAWHWVSATGRFSLGRPSASKLDGLGVDWSAVTTTHVYTAHSIAPLLPEIVLGRIGPSRIHGAIWHDSYPPVREIEYEMDVRGLRKEVRSA